MSWGNHIEKMASEEKSAWVGKVLSAGKKLFSSSAQRLGSGADKAYRGMLGKAIKAPAGGVKEKLYGAGADVAGRIAKNPKRALKVVGGTAAVGGAAALGRASAPNQRKTAEVGMTSEIGKDIGMTTEIGKDVGWQ